RQGIVHRDIKPANILIDGDGAVKLVDFGVAQISGATALTSTGVSLGTLTYAAPEQLGPGEVTAATDVYALGAVAYECLTGRPPFDAADPKTVVAGHLSTEPPPIDGVPEETAAVILKALAKEPADRWASATAFAEACRTAPSDRETAPLPPKQTVPPFRPPNQDLIATAEQPPPERPQRLWAWRIAFAAATAAVVVLLMTTLVWAPWDRGDDTDGAGSETTADAAEGATASEPEEDTASPTESPSPEDAATTEASGGTGQDTGGQDGGGEDTGGQDGGGGDSGDDGDAGQPTEEDEPQSTVPDVVGQSSGDARSELAAAGYDDLDYWMPNPYFYSPFPEQCEVVSQNPAAGTA
ncbi:serine/threonine-protein kinase, partial [Glycomyces tenuis]